MLKLGGIVSRLCGVGALIFALSGPALANHNNTVQVLGGFTLPGQGSGLLQAHSLPFSTDEDWTLTLLIGGDLGWAHETVTLSIDGVESIVLFDDQADPDFSYNDYAGPDCAPEYITLTLPKEKLAPLITDGALSFTFSIDNTIAPVCGASPNEYALSVSGELSFSAGDGAAGDAGPSPAEEAASVVSSVTQSRSSVTISSLPSLSGRMSGGAPSGGGGVSGSGASSSGSFALSGDLASLRRQGAAKEAARRFAAMGRKQQAAQAVAQNAALDGEPPEAGQSAAEETSGFDIWFGGSFSYFDVELGGVGQTGGVGTVQMGVDTRLTPDLLLGAAVFGDLLQSDVSTGSKSSGLGVMAGPYAVIDLDQGFYLEMLAAYGVAFNRIESDGLRDARYQSQRQLYTARLSGDWSAGPWLLRPSTRLTYYAERQESFEVGDGSIAPGDLTELGQLRFGPEVTYQMFWDGGAFLPFIGAEGVWAFKQSEQSVNGSIVSAEELTGTLSLGFDALFGETTIRAGGRLDGIGEPKLDTLTGEISVRTPLP